MLLHIDEPFLYFLFTYLFLLKKQLKTNHYHTNAKCCLYSMFRFNHFLEKNKVTAQIAVFWHIACKDFFSWLACSLKYTYALMDALQCYKYVTSIGKVIFSNFFFCVHAIWSKVACCLKLQKNSSYDFI